MSTLGNILWLLFGGLLVSALYIMAGLILCVTIPASYQFSFPCFGFFSDGGR